MQSTFAVIAQVPAEGSYVLIDLLLQRVLLALTALCQQFELSRSSGPFTHKAVGGSTLVSGPAEPALRIKTSSEPAVTLETSAAACSNFFGSEISVTTIWMFLRFAASSSSGPAVPRLRMMANTWFFGSADFGGEASVACHWQDYNCSGRLTRLSTKPNCKDVLVSI